MPYKIKPVHSLEQSTSKLSKVAFSGSYKDLKDIPQSSSSNCLFSKEVLNKIESKLDELKSMFPYQLILDGDESLITVEVEKEEGHK